MRLATLAKACFGYTKVADIGCDHGLVLYQLAEHTTLLQAIDNKPGPLNQAKANLNNFNHVIYTLSSGFEELHPEIECAVVAGMGGLLISELITHSNTKQLKRLVLQPNRDESAVRRTLEQHNWKIVDEVVVYENGQYYQIIIAEPGTKTLTDAERTFGPVLLIKRDPLFLKMWRERVKQLEAIPARHNDALQIKEELNL